MKLRYIPLLICATMSLSVGAQVNSPSSDGYFTRGTEMFADKNYRGCIDQLKQIERDALSSSQREDVAWMLANANFGIAGAAAKPYFEAFLAAYPYSLRRYDALMSIGDCAFESSYADALKIYLQVDRGALNASRAEDLDYRMAYCYMQMANFEQAKGLFERLAATRSYGNAARFYLGYIAYEKGDYKAAEAQFKTVDKTKAPGNMADYYLAQIYYLNGDYRKTLDTGRALLRNKGVAAQYVAEANRLVGESLYQLGNGSEAIGYLKKYVAAVENPQLSALYILGVSQYESGDYASAVKSLQKVSEGQDEMAQSANLFIGQALMRTGDKDAALLAFDKATKLPYDNEVQENAFYNYAVAKFDGATIPFGSSVATFEQFLSRYPNSRYTADVQQYIVDGYLSDHNYDAALQSINRMARPTPRVLAAKQKILYNLGAASLSAGNATTALVYLREAATLAKYDATTAAEVNLLTGEALYRTGDYAAAEDVLKKYIATSPKTNVNLPVAYYDLGYAHFARKQYAEATKSFEQVVNKTGNLPQSAVADAYNRMGDCSYYASDFARAETLYDKAFAANPAAGDYAVFQRALMKGYTRNHAGKIADLKRLMADFPTSSLNADAMLEMTASYIQLGDNASAIETYRRLVAEYPNTSQGRQGYLQLALTLLNDNRHDEAVEAYRTVIRSYPTSEEAREAAEHLKLIAANDGTLNEYAEFINSVEGAPTVDVAELERLAFDSAEKAYIMDENADKLRVYVKEYPSGAYMPKALNYLLADAQNRGAQQAAVEYAAALVDRYPDNSLSEAAYIVKATDDYENGRTERALDCWRALETRASSPATLNAARAGIMRASRDLGDFEAVAAAADALLQSSTEGAEDKNEAIFSKALALSQLGNTAEAQSLWASIAEMTDDLYGTKSAYYLSQSLYDEDKVEQARQRVEDLTRSGTPHAYWLARAFILLSDIHAAQGNAFEAREYLNALRENYPGSETDIFMMIDSRLNK